VARLILSGAAYELRPFKFRELRQAAPAIDRIAARARTGSGGLADMTEGMNDLLEVLAIGLEGKSADDLAAALDMTEVAGVQIAFVDLLTESGLKPAGEPEPVSAPADPTPDAPWPSRSRTSSPNSSPPAAATGTG